MFACRTAVAAVVGISAALCVTSPANAQVQERSGLYGGVIAGLAKGSLRSNDGTIELNPAGHIYGLRVGFNKAKGAWLVGVEADIAQTQIDGIERFAAGGYETTFESDHAYLSTLRARIGHNLGSAVIYHTLGVAFADTKATVGVKGPDNSQIGNTARDEAGHVGFAFGAGLELPINKRVSLTSEWLNVDFPKEEMTFDIGIHPEPMREHAHFDFNSIRTGISIKF